MTFTAMDFTTTSLPRRTNIANANGVISPVTGAGTVTLSPKLQLHNTLLVPSLSHKLLSVSQVTSDLNCIVLIYPTFCLLQDILTKEIIGRGYSICFDPLGCVGPSPITTVNGFKWFVLFVDDCTRMTWLYLLKHKDEVLGVFKSFHAMVQTQFSAKVQVLRSDNGGEYVNHQFREYFQQRGIIHETSCPQTPQQNGIVERKNRHVLETARALLIGAHAPTRFWADAVTTAVHLLNRMPSKVLDFQTPLQALSGYTAVPAILMLPPRVFGVSEIHVEPRQPEHVSLATEHHEDDHEAYVTSPSTVPENPTPENDPEVSSFNTNILAPPIGYVLPNRHNRGKPPSRYSPDIEGRRSRYPIANYVSTKKLNEPLKTFVHNISGCHVPTRVEEALGDPK
ncbi:Retrovirus-related Pol polyprotein from transposon TNT 1-94 [Vitis vinifera]|uniref:Retrovirus-related Pol polyprotein from transposon TNT 1-94 n=1 Tax=Vitis vinifera TaxID=29760 RepID=A0A438CNV9_VITVI|nr:Retrovirus-related Pol polyprotein from transposon TNT 1-94 [Vitis vinifera]